MKDRVERRGRLVIYRHLTAVRVLNGFIVPEAKELLEGLGVESLLMVGVHKGELIDVTIQFNDEEVAREFVCEGVKIATEEGAPLTVVEEDEK